MSVCKKLGFVISYFTTHANKNILLLMVSLQDSVPDCHLKYLQ